MREEVMVLPPSVERRKAGFSLSKKEEALLNTSKENKQWVVFEAKNAEKIRGFFLNSRDQQQAMETESVLAEKMKAESSKEGGERSTQPIKRSGDDEEAYKEGGLAGERMKILASSSGDGALLLQWGHRKKSRGSRTENHNLKLCNLIDESAASPCKTVRVQAEKGSAAAAPNTSSLAVKGTLKIRNGVIAKTKHLSSFRAAAQLHADPEEKRKQAKVSKGSPSDVRQERKGLPLGGGKRGHPSPLKQQHSLHQNKTCMLPDPKSASPDGCATPLAGGNEAKMELVWPKFVIALSRKEKEEDFLMLKGSKLPQRPKCRTKAVERAVNYCTPGSWLIDMSHSRYTVREKKRVKKKPRGLKAMESLDSDSDW
eukprot:c23355_g1_i2 orf=276-1385(+)